MKLASPVQVSQEKQSIDNIPTLKHDVVIPIPILSVGTSVLVNLLRVLGDPQHLANDTTLAFSDGTVLCASRAILSSQCLKLTALLYNSQGRLANDLYI